MSDYDDFDIELDEETLRQIEEEARRKVEAELLDDDFLKNIQAEALAEEGLDDIELDAETLREIDEEVRRLLASEGYDVPGTAAHPQASSETKVAPALRQASPPAAAQLPPAPRKTLPAVSAPDESGAVAAEVADGTGRRRAVDKARAKAEDRVRDIQRQKVKEGAALRARQTAATRRRVISEISEPGEQKSGKAMVIGFVGGLAALILIVVVVATLGKQKTAVPATAGNGATVGAAAAPPVQSPEDKAREEWDAMNKEIAAIVKKGQTAENLKAAIARLQSFKESHPDYADACDKDMARYQRALDFSQGK